MNETITQLIQNYGYVAVALLIAAENIFPPIPSELILTFTGFLTLSVPGAIIASTIGAFIGAVTLYWVGTFFDQDRLSRFAASKVGRRFGLSPEKITKTENYFNSHGRPATFFGRFIPVVRSLISLPAGMSRFSLARFSFYTILGTAIWNTVLIYAGRFAGNAYQQVVQEFEGLSLIVLIAFCAIAAAVYLLKKKGLIFKKNFLPLILTKVKSVLEFYLIK
ncbi:DedA family protein [Lactobacillus delbrueckii]|nr:DedA family protein [Lactobacillus delbrueckii]MCD5471142.1 DedA family protein [Lactobacillus delbrueckii subsp. bulgaricus]MCT3513767.1 DedA family protein [Lactobacillus delbrueckii subsp. bulgaricus]